MTKYLSGWTLDKHLTCDDFMECGPIKVSSNLALFDPDSSCVLRNLQQNEVVGSVNLSRHKVVDCGGGKKYFLRLSRSVEKHQGYLENAVPDMFNNVLAYKLSLLYDPPLPVNPQCFVVTSDMVAGVLSPLLSPRHVGQLDEPEFERISNRDLLPHLFVFEQLLMNIDDREEHLRLKEEAGGFSVWMVDHGRTLQAWRNDLEPSNIENNPKMRQPSSMYNPYRVNSKTGFDEPIRQTSNLPQTEIRGKIRETLGELEACIEVDEVKRFVNAAQTYTEMAELILRGHQKHIAEIVNDKLTRLPQR